jgi:hypothetical protein
MSGWNAFEVDKPFVVENFKRGFFDYLEVASHVAETEFFRWLLGKRLMEHLATTYPTPRKKEEVPLWVYLSAELTLKLHGASGFSTLPYVLHCGGLKDALGPEQVTTVQDPQSEEYQLQCEGYNHKNFYPRQTPCDQDFVRKLARGTPPEALEHWFGQALPPLYRATHAFDPEGIFIVDGSYLFVPDNENYEHSSLLRFDKHNHPLSETAYEALSPLEKRHCPFRRCYRTVTVLHTDREKNYYLYCGVRMLAGKDSETPHLRPLVEDVLASTKKGTVKWLVFDRGFIDGPTIAYLKKEHAVDSLFPLKVNMTAWDEAKRLAAIDPRPPAIWRPPVPPPLSLQGKPESIQKRERKRQETLRRKREEDPTPREPTVQEVRLRLVPQTRVWDECDVPIQVALLEEHLTDGSHTEWALATTAAVQDPQEMWDLYKVRPAIEERHRQLKCFWDLTSFRSTNFALVVNQVVFVLLAYSLMQIFLMKIHKEEYTQKTRERLLDHLLPRGRKVFLYYKNRVGTLTSLEHQELVLTLSEGARRRILGKTRQLRKHEMGSR